MKHGGGLRPNLWVLTFGPLCIMTNFTTMLYKYSEDLDLTGT